jgi:hypothetical protein
MRATPPLLALAAGKKVRPRRAPVVRPKEITLHMSVAKVLREHCLSGWIHFHVPNGERRDIKTGARLKKMGVRRGVPDLVLFSPSGKIHLLELKRNGETLSPSQEEFRDWAIRTGVPFVTAHSFTEALVALDTWGVLRIKIAAPGDQGGVP